MELSKLSVHLSIVRGCVARMSMRAFWARVETTWMFSGYIVMATAKRASATFSRPRHAQIMVGERGVHTSKQKFTSIHLSSRNVILDRTRPLVV